MRNDLANIRCRAKILTPAKLNLALRIIGRRADGFHLMEMVTVPVDLFDRITVQLGDRSGLPVSLWVDGTRVADPALNLAGRAALLFRQQSGLPSGVSIRLQKRIPARAGLGGGSSDAAAVLRCMNQLSVRPQSPETLAEWGLQLGADVPFFLAGYPAVVTGIGEQIQPARLTVPPFAVVAFQGSGLSTEEVFRAYDDALTNVPPLSSTCRSATRDQRFPNLLANDLEAVAQSLDPKVAQLKASLDGLGSVGSAMTGSGSAVFGLWENIKDARAAASKMRRYGVWARAVRLLERSPELELS